MGKNPFGLHCEERAAYQKGLELFAMLQAAVDHDVEIISCRSLPAGFAQGSTLGAITLSGNDLVQSPDLFCISLSLML